MGAVDDRGKLIGVVIVGRPVTPMQDDRRTLEVNRCCTDGTKNACSFLYAAAWRVTKELGYTRLITYTLATESGTSLVAAGFRPIWLTEEPKPRRPRGGKNNRPISVSGLKVLWERTEQQHLCNVGNKP
jgi:hypothetical protein